MRFIVDLYRIIILGGFGVVIIAVVFGFLKLSSGRFAGTDASIYFALGASAVILLMIIGLGITATFISMHDRHAELVDELKQLNRHLGPDQ